MTNKFTLKITLRDCIFSALFASIIVALSFIKIQLPISPVPITAQTLGIMLTGCILTTKQSAFSLITFLLLGFIGLPVFSGGTSGIGVLTGPTGGYLIGFLAGVIVISLIRGSGKNIVQVAVANVLGGIIVVYIFGVLWLSLKTGMSILKTLEIGAIPYIIGDVLKVCIATPAAIAIRKQVKHLI